MRIGIDGRLINQTGVGRYTQELVENLEKIDKDNTYLLFLGRTEYQSLKFKSLNFGKRLADIRWHSLREQLFMPWVLWKEHLDLVHFPYFSVPILYPGKFVVTIHDLIIDHFETGQASTLPLLIYKLKRWGYKIVTWVTLHRAVRVITVSEATKKEIVEHYGIKPEKIVVTYEAAGKRILNQVQNDVIIKDKYFLYVGNAYPHKNLERLLEAIVNFKLKIENFKFVLVGPEDYFYRKLKEKIKELNLGNSIIFYGQATEEQLASLYKNAIALVFPSLMEGFGLPAVEAIRNNCLVLCSDIPVFHEILKDAAIYFDPNDADDIAQKMEEVSRLTPRHGGAISASQKKIIENYSWEKLAKETLEIYKKSINSNYSQRSPAY